MAITIESQCARHSWNAAWYVINCYSSANMTIINAIEVQEQLEIETLSLKTNIGNSLVIEHDRLENQCRFHIDFRLAPKIKCHIPVVEYQKVKKKNAHVPIKVMAKKKLVNHPQNTGKHSEPDTKRIRFYSFLMFSVGRKPRQATQHPPLHEATVESLWQRFVLFAKSLYTMYSTTQMSQRCIH